ncbi:MAG: transposase [Sweet potato little leaf phytoplasma]|nr:transposase [Sweet potato little leaf phytoplasma]
MRKIINCRIFQTCFIKIVIHIFIIFWAHPKSISLLNSFNIVLILDNTYKINRYKWPLLEVVGHTSTEKSFTIAFSYMELEQYPNFLWALQYLKRLMKDVHAMPKVIVSDFEGALVHAIETVFPTSTHLLCQFHIKKNVKGNFKNYVRDPDDESLLIDAWVKQVDSKDEDEYETSLLSQFEKLCQNSIGLLEYVNRVYLAEQKEKFFDAWTNMHMPLGNTTSNR